jgi:hypothetical protein
MNLGRSTQHLRTILLIYVYSIVYSPCLSTCSTRPDTKSTELYTKGLQDRLSKVYGIVYQRSTGLSIKGLHKDLPKVYTGSMNMMVGLRSQALSEDQMVYSSSIVTYVDQGVSTMLQGLQTTT